MAKKVTGYIKLQIPAGKATPAPPVGPALGQHGVNIVEFTKQFNARTADKGDVIIPVVITVYADRSFSFITKTPPAAVLLKKAKVYEVIARRFLSIFYPPAISQKVSLTVLVKSQQLPQGERFFASFKVLTQEGYLGVSRPSFFSSKKEEKEEKNGEEEEFSCDEAFLKVLQTMKKGEQLPLHSLSIKEGETSPPKRYNSGSLILTMENAGQFIEDEELRAQIKGSGIGTSATRAEILKKLVTIEYLALNKKTQTITPTLMGEMIYDVVSDSIRPLLNPALTASWEKGLTGVAEGTITSGEYMDKLDDFVRRRTNIVKQLHNQSILYQQFDAIAGFYQKKETAPAVKKAGTAKKRTEKKENAEG